MNIVKTFTEPEAIKKALLLIDGASYAQHPLIKIRYMGGYNKLEPLTIKGGLWNTNISSRDSSRYSDYIVAFDFDALSEYKRVVILLGDIIRLDISDEHVEFFGLV